MHIKATLCVSIYFIVKIEIITVSTRFGKCVKNVFVKVDKKHAINIVSMRGRYLKVAFLCLLCRRICRRVSSIWAINICMYVCMYVYEDSNSGFFCLPNVYVYAHKWLEHQLLGHSLPVSNFTVCY